MRLQTSGRRLLLCALAALLLLVPAATRAQSQGDVEHLTLDDVSNETIGIVPAKTAGLPENARSAEPSRSPEPSPSAKPSKPADTAEPSKPADTTQPPQPSKPSKPAEPGWLTEITRAMASPATQP
ncbi:MAG: hypothetical protein JRS35_23405, partial [Deltaproteobacteria bacterium]|nr:hypothetical protein [Deltaproteobacteria bacterium]